MEKGSLQEMRGEERVRDGGSWNSRGARKQNMGNRKKK